MFACSNCIPGVLNSRAPSNVHWQCSHVVVVSSIPLAVAVWPEAVKRERGVRGRRKISEDATSGCGGGAWIDALVHIEAHRGDRLRCLSGQPDGFFEVVVIKHFDSIALLVGVPSGEQSLMRIGCAGDGAAYHSDVVELFVLKAMTRWSSAYVTFPIEKRLEVEPEVYLTLKLVKVQGSSCCCDRRWP